MKKQVHISITLLALILAITAVFVSCDETNSSETTTAAVIDAIEKPTETTKASETVEETHVHTWNSWVTVRETTCTAEGIQERCCTCGKKESQSIPKLEHTEVIDNAVPSTCATYGKTEG